jgi:hypothetical protein
LVLQLIVSSCLPDATLYNLATQFISLTSSVVLQRLPRAAGSKYHVQLKADPAFPRRQVAVQHLLRSDVFIGAVGLIKAMLTKYIYW